MASSTPPSSTYARSSSRMRMSSLDARRCSRSGPPPKNTRSTPARSIDSPWFTRRTSTGMPRQRSRCARTRTLPPSPYRLSRSGKRCAMTTRGAAEAASAGAPLVGTEAGAAGAVGTQETAGALPSSLGESAGSCDTVEQGAGAATGAATDEESARSPVGAEEGRPLPNPPAASRAGASEADAGTLPDAGTPPDTDAPPNAGALSDAGVLPNAGALPGASALPGAGAGTEAVAPSAAAAAAVRAACTEGSAV